MPRNLRGSVLDVKVIPGEECLTQHTFVVGHLRIKTESKVKYLKCRPRVKVCKLKDRKIRGRFQEKLSKEKDHVNATEVNEFWGH